MKGNYAPASIPLSRAVTVVRVRPWIKQESSKCPEQCPVPRPALQFSSCEKNALQVLDPQNHFREKASFVLDHLIWSFWDPNEEPSKVSRIDTFEDVFTVLGTPIVESVISGFNATLIASGASETGKQETLFGFDQDRKSGLIHQIFDAVMERFRSTEDLLNREVSFELEAVAEGGGVFTDLLAAKLETGKRKSQHPDDIKLHDDGIEPVLVGVTRARCSDLTELNPMMHSAATRFRAVKSPTYLQILRITETFTFNNPANPSALLSKQRKTTFTLVMMNTPGLDFARCIDVAVARDTGELPHAKVPVRDSALTRLLTECFGGNCNTFFLTCVSPFFGHVKETTSALVFAAKVRRLRCCPRLNEDSATSQLRMLSEELRTLQNDTQEVKESISIVQGELTRRNSLLKEKLRTQQVYTNTYRDAEFFRRQCVLTNNVCKMRLRLVKKRETNAIVALENELSATELTEANATQRAAAFKDAILSEESSLRALEPKVEELTKERDQLSAELAELLSIDSGDPTPAKDTAREMGRMKIKHEQKMVEFATQLAEIEFEHCNATNAKAESLSRKEAAARPHSQMMSEEHSVTRNSEKEATLHKEIQQEEQSIESLDKNIEKLEKERPGCCSIL